MRSNLFKGQYVFNKTTSQNIIWIRRSFKPTFSQVHQKIKDKPCSICGERFARSQVGVYDFNRVKPV